MCTLEENYRKDCYEYFVYGKYACEIDEICYAESKYVKAKGIVA